MKGEIVYMKGKAHKLLSLVIVAVLVFSMCAVMAVPAAGITAANVVATPVPTTASSTAQYTVTFDHTLAAPVGTVITIVFPSAVGVPSSISYSHIRQGAGASAAAATAAETTYAVGDPAAVVTGNSISLALKNAITATQFASVTFSQLAGFTNPNLASPASATGYRVIVSSTLEAATTQAVSFAIIRSVSMSPTS